MPGSPKGILVPTPETQASPGVSTEGGLPERGAALDETKLRLLATSDLAIAASQGILTGTTEQALRESEERYRRLVDALPLAVAVHVEGTILFVNQEALHALRAPSDRALIGHRFLDFVHPDDRSKLSARGADTQEPGIEAPLSTQRFIRLDGEVFDGEVQARAVSFGGQPAGQVVFWDVTERRRAEEALSASETRWRVLGENAPAFIMTLDREGRILSLNRAFPGRTVAELIGTSIHEYPSFRDVQKLRAVLEAVFERRERVEYEISYQRRDGTTVWLLNNAAPVEQDGRVVAAIHVSIDISERKRVEDTLRESEERYRHLLEGLLDGVAVGCDSRIVFANTAAARILGVEDPAELAGVPAWELVHPEGRAFAGERVRSVLETGQPAPLVVERFLRRDGETIVVEAVLLPIKHRGQPAVQLVFRDVSDRLRLEEQLRQAEKMTALGQLAGGIAHDFNNQLAGILGYAELLRERVGDNETLRRYAEGIVTGAQRSARLTQQLLAFARKGKYQVVPVDLHGILGEVLAILEHSIDKRIQIRRALSPTPIQVVGDPAQLQNALLNLAINGRDAMPEGGELTLATEVVTVDQGFQQATSLELAAGRYGCVRISDTGVGMDEDTRRRAFEPFFTTKEPGHGTGLGLSAAYGIVRNHLGALRLDSAVGHGTTVAVFLPLAEPAPEAAPAEQPSAEASFLRILLVDDEDLVRAATADMLKALGHTVRECRDGSDAIDVFSTSPEGFDLVILDMVMPLMSGADALARMRAVNPRLRAILSSGYSLDEEAQQLLGTGSLVLIQKPFTISDLAEAIARAERTEG
jgi:PAS domain S-box-containing protein